MNTTTNAAVIFTVTPDARLTERQILNRIRKYEDAKARAKEAEKEADAIRAELIGDREAFDLSTDAYSLMLTPFRKAVFDSKSFRADHPDLWEQYQTSRTETRFTARVK